jgi:hypothetical protein
MCLFLQNQRFQEVTARLMTDMAAASAGANQTLAGVLGGLREQSEALAEGAARLEGLRSLQRETRELAARGAEGVAALIGRAENLSVAMAASLQLSVGPRRAGPPPGRGWCDPTQDGRWLASCWCQLASHST